jgi:general secretion pathway protein K
MNMSGRKNVKRLSAQQRGVAIVLAMSVVTLAAIAAIAIMVAQSTWARQSELEAQHLQAQILILTGVDWSRAVLSDDSRLSTVDHLGEPWALRLPPMPVDNGKLQGFLEDQQGKFNLNNLVREGKVNLDQLAHFKRLLAILGLPGTLAEKLVDWIDSDNGLRPDGAEDGYYLVLQPPYLAANRPLVDVAELSQVAGFDNSVRARLSPFLSALPRFTAVNVNTASPEVLSAIVDGLDIDRARALVAKREQAYFRDPADFFNRLPQGVYVEHEEIAVNSDYFMTWVHVTIGEAEAQGEALLARRGKAWPAIVWHKTL